MALTDKQIMKKITDDGYVIAPEFVDTPEIEWPAKMEIIEIANGRNIEIYYPQNRIGTREVKFTGKEDPEFDFDSYFEE